MLLLPLDSRPPCTTLAQDLGRLASIDVIVPPNELLDNYHNPADRTKLTAWLSQNIQNYPAAVISGDLLIHGGLLGSRLPLGTAADEQNFLTTLNNLPAGDITIFSIIPRLLVSDNLLPDAWYQWHLMRYSTLRDIVEQFGDYPSTRKLEEIKARIPAEILQNITRCIRTTTLLTNSLLLSAAAKLHAHHRAGRRPALWFAQPQPRPRGCLYAPRRIKQPEPYYLRR